MMMKQGDLSLLNDPVAARLLERQTIMRLSYCWLDGSPRVVPHWFLWNGREVMLASPADSPKVRALQYNPAVALTIDTVEFPPQVLMLRGVSRQEIVDGPPREFAETAERYFGPEAGKAWVNQARALTGAWARISITPTWVGVLDYETRFPSALMRGMARAGAEHD
jgi:pyridoxamine 5'-phosphate oxidase-like protein